MPKVFVIGWNLPTIVGVFREIRSQCTDFCSEVDNDTETINLNVKNKYFSSNLNLIACYPKDDSFDIGSWLFAQDIQGFVILFDPLKNETLSIGKRLHSEVINVNCSLRLCMAIDNAFSDPNENPNQLKCADIIEWCLDNEAEFVDFYDPLAPSSVAGEDEGDYFHEKFGFDRLFEVLSSTIWTSTKVDKPVDDKADDDGDFQLLSQAIQLRNESRLDLNETDEKRTNRISQASDLIMQFMKTLDTEDMDDKDGDI